jgi:hypothetical protein
MYDILLLLDDAQSGKDHLVETKIDEFLALKVDGESAIDSLAGFVDSISESDIPPDNKDQIFLLIEDAFSNSEDVNHMFDNEGDIGDALNEVNSILSYSKDVLLQNFIPDTEDFGDVESALDEARLITIDVITELQNEVNPKLSQILNDLQGVENFYEGEATDFPIIPEVDEDILDLLNQLYDISDKYDFLADEYMFMNGEFDDMRNILSDAISDIQSASNLDETGDSFEDDLNEDRFKDQAEEKVGLVREAYINLIQGQEQGLFRV